MSRQFGRTIVFAGGGTAGHVEPALASARAWNAHHPNDRCVFLGTPSGLETTLVPAAGYELRTIEKVAMPRKVSFDLLALPLRLIRSVAAARKIIKDADLLIGFGGYLSASAYLASAMARVPFVIHEANAKPGWANRLGAIFTRYIAVARPTNSGGFAHATITGLPLRSDVRSAYFAAVGDWHAARVNAKKSLGWDESMPSLLVLGGSQGSTFINSQIAQALPGLTNQGIQILHSVGPLNPLPQNVGSYKAVPYISDMATAYLAADVVLARSGAVTCAEVGALGRMAIFIPLAIGNGEQARNAQALAAKGRAVVISQSDFSAQWLEENIEAIVVRSRELPESGLNEDVDAQVRIVLLMEDAIEGKSR